MLLEPDILDYIKLCRVIGSDFQSIQGTGGNISIKSGDEIIIKSSGKRLAETTLSYGYVICSIQKARELIDINSTEFIKSVIKGDINTPPSMELSFHLLPFKYIVHIHPVFLIPKLCANDWKSLTLGKYICSYIDYLTPGLDLGKAILEKPPTQVYFLQNHGIILCAESMDDMETIIEQLYSNYLHRNDSDKYSATLFQLYKLLESTTTPVIKKCEHIDTIYERLFFPFTPDIHLFLKEQPLFQELASESLETLFTKYVSKYSYFPSVIRTPIGVFVVGKSFQQCLIIEEILESYIHICKHAHTNLQTLNLENMESLQNSEQEKHRLQIN